MEYQKDLDKAIKQIANNKKLVNRLGKAKPKELDDRIHQLHDESFKTIDCLKCANCCKTTSPIFVM